MMEDLRFSIGAAIIIFLVAFMATRRLQAIPGRMQSAAELLFGGFDDFIQGIIGPKGRKLTPFIGTLFIYIITMNILGLIPFMKSPTANLSVTAALAICVFVYVQYYALKELGLFGYIDHMAGKPRGALAVTILIPVFIFFTHFITELIRPVTLSLRLRSNIWGDDLLLGLLAGLGFSGLPLLMFSTVLVIVGAVVQAAVFCLLTTVYFSLILKHE